MVKCISVTFQLHLESLDRCEVGGSNCRDLELTMAPCRKDTVRNCHCPLAEGQKGMENREMQNGSQDSRVREQLELCESERKFKTMKAPAKKMLARAGEMDG